MKQLYAFKTWVAFTLVLGSLNAFAAADFFCSEIAIDNNGAITYYKVGGGCQFGGPFPSGSLGGFAEGDALIIDQLYNNTFENGPDNVLQVEFNYRIIKSGEVPGAFIPVVYTTNVGAYTGVPGDLQFLEPNANIDMLAGLVPGEYELEFYWRGTADFGGGTFDFFESNGGSNFNLTFSYCLADSFSDGDFTTGTTWTGDTADWIVTPDATTGPGATGSNTLALDAAMGPGTSYLATEWSDWRANQTWEFYFGRRNQSATATNNTYVWLYANEADLSSSTVDGYRIRHGQNGGSGDPVVLEVVTDGVGTAVLSTLTNTTNSIVDISIAVRVTRDQDGNFSLETSTMPLATSDGVAADADFTAAINVDHGMATDNTYAPSGTGYAGVVANYSSGASALTAVEFDRFSLCTDNINTRISFVPAAVTVNEDDGTATLTLAIVGADADNASTVDVALISGDATRIDNYTTQTVTFPAGSSADQTVTITLTDDMLCNGTENLMFELTNPMGGYKIDIGASSTDVISIVDDESGYETVANLDLETGTLDGWVESDAGWWEATSTAAINGSFSLNPSSAADATAGRSAISYSLGSDHTEGVATTWRFLQKNGNLSVSANNRWLVYLMSDTEDLKNGNPNGYAVGLRALGGTSNVLQLYKMTNGVPSLLINSTYAWGTVPLGVGIEVTRSATGEWELSIDENESFDNLVAQGVAIDDEFTNLGYFGVDFYYTTSRVNNFWIDDISIDQVGCAETWFSQSTGNSSDNIWDVTAVGTAGPAVFNKFSNISIQNGHTVTFDEDFTIEDLVIEAGGTMEGDATTACLFGSMFNDGTFNAGTSSIQFVGTTPQLQGGPSGVDFYDVVLDNATGATFADASVYGQLDLKDGTLTTLTPLLLVSDATRTGNIGPIAAGAGIAGMVELQRNIPAAGSNGLINLSNPLVGVDINDWADDCLVTGIPGSSPGLFASVKSYDETAAGTVDDGFVDVNTIATLDPNTGYLMFNFAPAIDLSVTGTIRQGNIDIPLTFTNNGDPSADGWNLVPNVYPSEIDFDALSDLSPGVTAYSVYNGTSRSYDSYSATTGLGDADQHISSSQSFWVQVSSAAVLQYEESVKSNVGQSFQRNVMETPSIAFTLGNGSFLDRSFAGIFAGTTANYDEGYDVRKIKNNENPANMVSFLGEDGEHLKIQAFELEEEGMIIPMAITAQAGEYTLTAEDLAFLPEDICVSIKNLTTGETTPLQEGDIFPIAVDTFTDEVLFELHLSGAVASSKTDISCFAANDGSATVTGAGQGPWTYTWYNEGMEIILQETTEGSSAAENLAFGTYFVEITSDNMVCSSVVEYIEINEPVQETPLATSDVSLCNNEAVDVMLNVEGAESYTYSINQNGELLEQGTLTGEGFVSLAGGVYTIGLQSACNSFELEVDNTDPNATIAAFEAPEIVEILVDEEMTVFFENTSDNADAFFWSISNGDTSTEESLNYTFPEEGEYTVSLQVSNDVCQDVISKNIIISQVESVEEIGSLELNYFVSQDQLWLTNGTTALNNATFILTDLTGKQVAADNNTLQAGEQFNMDMSNLAQGIYHITVVANGQEWTAKIVK